MRRPIVLALLVAAVAGCGRREKRAPFDEQPPAVVVAGRAKPLSATGVQVRWGTLTLPATVDAGGELPVTVHLTNAGDTPWPDKATAEPQLKDGSYAVRVTHAWVRAEERGDGRVGAERTDLPRTVNPGESIDLPLNIRAPATPGEYRLEIELVQELVLWFADLGADRITRPVRVVAAGGAPARTTASPPIPSPRAPGRQ